MSSVTTQHGGARRGAGRRGPKSLLELVAAGTFSVSRHGPLLWSDRSLLEAAAADPEKDALQRMAEINRLAWERRSRDMVSWFGRALRGLREEGEIVLKEHTAKSAGPHRLWIEERVEDGWLVAELQSGLETSPPMIVVRVAEREYCPDCVRRALEGVLERYEDAAVGTSPE